MEVSVVLPTNGGTYLDARGGDRYLRMTWHAAHNVFIVSIWRDGRCAATFQLDRAMSADVVSDLVRCLSMPVELTWSDRQISTRSIRTRERVAAAARRLWVAVRHL